MFDAAICRRPARTFADGLTSAEEGRPDFARAMEQFDAYVDALHALGLRVDVLEAFDAHPDGHFVEDVAVLTPGAIVITRPGAESRRAEIETIETLLAERGALEHVAAPGTLEGGDVLRVGSTFFVGRSARTNAEGAAAFAAIVRRQDMDCVEVPVPSGLHLKSSVNVVDDETIVVAPDFADEPAFAELQKIVVPSEEAYAACSLRVNDGVLVPAGYPRTTEAIAGHGLAVQELDVSEFRKMDGGLSCLSLRFGQDGS